MAHTPVTTLATAARSRAGAGGREPDGKIVLDDLSKQIIEQLQQDGRRSYAAIGKAVGLSEAAVRQRVQRLFQRTMAFQDGGQQVEGRLAGRIRHQTAGQPTP